MNFFGVLKKFGAIVAGVEHVAVPVISILEPQLAPVLAKLDNWVTRLNTAVVTVEASVTDAKSGGLKQEAVVKDFVNGIADIQAGLALAGKTMQYDQAELQGVVDAFAAAYNKAATFKTHWKVVDLPKPPA